jgi:hypothetical protein
LHVADRIAGIGARGQFDGQGRRRLAVEMGHAVVILAADLDTGHIRQPDRGTVRVDPQQDLFELFRSFQAGLGHDRVADLLARKRGGTADLTGGDLGILGLDGGFHVAGSQLVVVELLRIEPDTHGILRAEQGGLAHAVHAADGVEDGARDVVAQVAAVHGPVSRDKANAQEDAGRGPIAQLIDTLHLLFNDLGDGVLDGFGRGAGMPQTLQGKCTGGQRACHRKSDALK